MEVGIFLVATGSYIDFVYPLVEDISKYFLVNHKKTIYVFTDYKGVIDGVTVIPVEHKPWPYPTLYRYHIITDLSPKHDYYYYLDVDMRIVDFVGEEILGELVATKHPGFYNKQKICWPHSYAFLSHSYTPFNKVRCYYAGAVNGGSAYLKMADTIKKWVDADAENDFVPAWHDESYLNRYLALNPPAISLDPSYCYPENDYAAKQWRLKKFSPKIVCLYKEEKYIENRDTIQKTG